MKQQKQEERNNKPKPKQLIRKKEINTKIKFSKKERVLTSVKKGINQTKKRCGLHLFKYKQRLTRGIYAIRKRGRKYQRLQRLANDLNVLTQAYVLCILNNVYPLNDDRK